MRFLILLLGLFLIYLVIRTYYRSLRKPAEPPVSAAREETMVRCVVCGVNVPRSEAIYSGGEFFCGEEHRRSRRS